MRAMILVRVGRLHVATIDKDDNGEGLDLLDFARGLEELKELLLVVIVSIMLLTVDRCQRKIRSRANLPRFLISRSGPPGVL